MQADNSSYIRIYKIIAPLLLVAALWKLVSWLLTTIKGVPFPAPEDVVGELISYLRGNPLLGHSLAAQTWATLQRWLWGYLLGSSAGIVIGLLCTVSRWLAMMCYPVVLMLQMVPGLAWIPVAILVVGIGPETSIFMARQQNLWKHSGSGNLPSS